KAVRKHHERCARRTEARQRIKANRSGRYAKKINSELYESKRIPEIRQVWRHRDGGDDLEREPTWTMAPAVRCSNPPRAGHRLEAIPDQPPDGYLRCQKVPRVPAVLALLIRHSGSMDGSPDRYRALVYRI